MVLIYLIYNVEICRKPLKKVLYSPRIVVIILKLILIRFVRSLFMYGNQRVEEIRRRELVDII